MTITPNQLLILSLVLLAVGLMVGAGALVAAEIRRTRSGQVIGRAIRQAVVAPDLKAAVDAPADPDAPIKPELELPFHWLDSRIGRALVADEDRNLIDQCGLPSKRAQLVFLVTRILLAFMLPLLAYVFWSSGHTSSTVTIVLSAAAAIGFMAPKWVLGRIAAEFGFEAAGLNLNFLHHLERQVAVGIERTGPDVGNFLTVDDECVFRTACAVDLELSRTGFRASCRRHFEDTREVRSFRKELRKLG